MKSFKIRPLSIAVTMLLATTPMSVVSNAANHQGDLEVYKGGLPLGEIGANSGQEAETKAGNAALLMLDMSSIDGEISVGDFNQRKDKMIKTIAHLMKPESEGGFNEDSLIGIGVYPALSIGSSVVNGSGLDGGIYIPVAPLGPKQADLTDAEWQKSQRKKIIDYVEALQSTPAFSPMAPAYAEAGAYMMGTTTSRLVDKGAISYPPVLTQVQYTPFRRRSPQGLFRKYEWEYCSFSKAELISPLKEWYRLTCNEEDWVSINKDLVSSYHSDSDDNNDFLISGERVQWKCSSSVFFDCDFANWPEGYLTRYLTGDTSNGWMYYYDNKYGNSISEDPAEPDRALPSLPPTNISNFSTSGIRNSPSKTRRTKSYQYDQPNYRICKPSDTQGLENPYQSNPENRSSNAIVQNAGIFFITAGIPSSATAAPLNEMNSSLGIDPISDNPEERARILTEGVTKSYSLESKYTCNLSGMLPSGSNVSHWGCMGAYSRRLNSTNNPTTRAIKTGVFLVSPIENVSVNETTCAVTGAGNNNNNLENACRLGSSAYGDGGFYHTDIDNSDASIEAFAAAIKQNVEALGDDPYKFGMVPSGPITVAANTLRPGELLDHGYLPLISPNPGSGKVQWVGNLRKYKASANGYVGKNNATPFKDASNQGAASAILAGTTQDYWSIASVRSQDKAGGAFENIKLPTTANTANARKVYVSDFTQTSSSTEPGVQLKKVSPAVGVAGSFDQVKVFTPSGVTTALDSKDVVIQRLLLNYMGFPLKDYVPGTTTTDDILSHLDLAQSEKVMGAVLHSTPVSFVQSATLDSATGKYTPNKEYTLFGAMDNALHLINTNSGDEVFSFFPREVLAHKGQYKGITPELSGVVGDNLPSFGVDGPWAVYTSYAKNAANKIEANKIYAYGGTRLGAKAYYGLNLTNVDKPRQLFTITNTGNFKRLGYSWGKPVVTKIRWQGKPKLVAILSGGYDAEYDKTDAQRMDVDAEGNPKATYTDKATMGNAIYVVDAMTGEALIVASNTGANTNDTTANNSDNAFVTKSTDTIAVLNSHMKYSIPGGVKVLDRDADELADHVYFADMDGQVFRMDINNGASKPETVVSASSTTSSTNPKVRVHRVADLNGKTSSPGPRLYESPTVTIQTSPSGQRFATISVASGDRSNPLSTNMSNHVDAVYTLYDKDVAQKGLFNSNYTLAPTITAVTPNNSLGVQSLAGAALTYNASGLFAASAGNAYDNYSGWMSPLNKFGDSAASNTADTASIKAMGALPAIANKLYVSAYNPNDGLINKNDGCLPEVLGTTELHQYCLPYGICTVSSSGSGGGQYQRFRAGKGILTPSFGTEFKDGAENKMSRGLIGQNGNTNTFTALDSGAPGLKSSFTFKGALRSLAWFDMQSKGVSTSE